MRWILLFLLINASAFGTAQKTETITKKFGRSKQVFERYDVLASNRWIRHGTYVSYFQLPEEKYKTIKKTRDSLEFYVKICGAYVQGKKQGEWLEYLEPGVLYSKGTYENGKMSGVWTTRRENGEVLEKYNHSTRQKQMPEIRIVVRYPPQARAAGVQGTVVIQYRLASDCSLGELHVIQSLHPDCDREALLKLQKYYQYLKTYGPAQGCEEKTDTFSVHFRLE